MSQRYKIAVDAMGGDYAPDAIVAGSVMAVNKISDIDLVLLGDEAKIKASLEQHTYDASRIEIHHTTEVITNEDSPVMAIRRKKDSSLVVGMRMVKEQKVSGIVSAGNTGAILAGGTFVVGRIKGIERPALAPLIPTKNGHSVLLDVGANADCKPQYLAQFAQMGYIYAQNALGIENPKVGLVNIGTEAGKGNMLTKETYSLLEEMEHINFIGNVEARDLTDGQADVLVCDGFTGNVVLKNMEGMGSFILKAIKDEIMTKTRYKMGGLLIKPMIGALKKKFSSQEVGGVAMLGVNGLVVKAHGNSNDVAIFNAIRQAKQFVKAEVSKTIQDSIQK